MANYTTNLHLEKPEYNETADIEIINQNMEKIDSELTYKTATGTGTEIKLLLPEKFGNGYNTTFIASANNGAATTTINGKPLYKPNTTTPPNVTSGKAYTIWYNEPGDCFFLKASAEGNAPQSSVLAGATFSNDNDTGIMGTMPNKTNTTTGWCGYETISVQTHPRDSSQGLVTIPIQYGNELYGYYGEGSKITGNIANLNPSNIRAGVKIGRYDGSAGNCITGTFTSDATAHAGHILSGKTAYVNGNKVTGNIASLGATTYTPKATNQTIASGKYLSGVQTIKGDANLVASNIIKGKSIFGVAGSATVLKSQTGTFSRNMTTPLTLVFPFEPKIVRFFNSARPSSMSANDIQIYLSLRGGYIYLGSLQGYTGRFTTNDVTINGTNPWSITFTRTNQMNWSDSYEAYGW